MPHSIRSTGRSIPPSPRRVARKSSRTTRGTGSEGRSEKRGYRGNEGGMQKPIEVALSAGAVATLGVGVVATRPEGARGGANIQERGSLKGAPPPVGQN